MTPTAVGQPQCAVLHLLHHCIDSTACSTRSVAALQRDWLKLPGSSNKPLQSILAALTSQTCLACSRVPAGSPAAGLGADAHAAAEQLHTLGLEVADG